MLVLKAEISYIESIFWCNFKSYSYFKTSSAIAEKDDGPHGTSPHYVITKPRIFNFQNFLKTDRPTDQQTYSPIKTTTRRLKIGYLGKKIVIPLILIFRRWVVVFIGDNVGLSVCWSVCLQKILKIEKSRFCDYIVSACAMGPVVYFCNGITCFRFHKHYEGEKAM